MAKSLDDQIVERMHRYRWRGILPQGTSKIARDLFEATGRIRARMMRLEDRGVIRRAGRTHEILWTLATADDGGRGDG